MDQDRSTGRVISLRAKLAAGTAAVLLSAMLCEGMARLVFEAPPDPTREPAVLYQSLPGVGFIPASNQTAWIDDGLVTTNALGLRGEEPVRPKPAGTVRVLTIGDSTTFGWGVHDPETYPAQLEARLNAETPGQPWDVVNGGVSGYDLRRASRFLAHFAPLLEPDIVLVGLFWNDLPYEAVSPDGVPQAEAGRAAAANGEAPPAGGTDGLPEADEITSRAPFRIRGQPSQLNRLLRKSRALYVLRQMWAGAMAPTAAASNQLQWEAALLEGRDSAAIDAAWEDVERSLTEIRDLGAAGGFDVGVLTIPIRAQVEQRHPDAAYQTRVRRISERLGLFVIDPLPSLESQPDPGRLFIPYDRMHYSALGNAQLAAATFEALRHRLPAQH